MKKTIMITVAVVVSALVLYKAYTLGLKKQESTSPSITPSIVQATPTQTLVGGDKDVHGCIPSAGYSWCPPKNKCLRIWEEKCYESVSQEIQYILAAKYNRPVDEVKITIRKDVDNYVSGSVLFGKGGPGEGGIFLAIKTGNIWEVVYDGNGSIDCIKMREQYKFPDEILKPNFCD
jgi:hypothetical protein